MQSYSPEQRIEYNAWLNSVSRLAYKIAGSARRFYELPRDARHDIREKAKLLHELGADYGTAAKAEAVRDDGFVYIITHPRLDGVKIGRAFDPEARLASYQTGCPRREYELIYALYFDHCKTVELAVHACLNDHQLEGEWFDVTPDRARSIIESYA